MSASTIRAGDPGARTLTKKTVAAFAVLDVLLKSTTIPSFGDLVSTGAGGSSLRVLGDVVVINIWITLTWLAALFLLVRSAERALEPAETAAAMDSAAHRLRQLPARAAALWAAQWCALLGGVVCFVHEPASWTALALFLVTMILGPLALSHILVVWLVAPMVGALTIRARERSFPISLPPVTTRRRLAFYCLCLCIAPTSYMASVVFTARAANLSYEHLLGTVLVYFAAIAMFAILCALLISATITGPVGEMAAVVRTIIRERDFSRVGRLPQHQRDELGALADLTNEMIDHLERTAAERSAMRESLEALNATLEERVAERTARLSQTNAELAAEMKARAQVEVELRQAQKLEAVGRLAGGIAHEINTPVQFVSDNVRFVQESLQELGGLFDKLRLVNRSVLAGCPSLAAAEEAADAEVEADFDYVREHVPPALEQSMEGLGRIATIVRSMKEFAHPDQKEMRSVDINHGIASTLTIAKGEYKYVAEVTTELGELPPVLCHAGDLNQVVLNILINATDAISEVTQPSGGLGKIHVSTRLVDDCVVISIADTGGGIAEAIQDRIFEPFFTTKTVGRGTGQGLALARSVAEKHGGDLTFTSEPGRGTTFSLRLPVDGLARRLKAVAA